MAPIRLTIPLQTLYRLTPQATLLAALDASRRFLPPGNEFMRRYCHHSSLFNTAQFIYHHWFLFEPLVRRIYAG